MQKKFALIVVAIGMFLMMMQIQNIPRELRSAAKGQSKNLNQNEHKIQRR